MNETSELPHRYFAYGSNMSDGQMADRCPGAEPDGVSELADYRFLINERGVATVVPETGTVVHGVVWRLNDHHVEALDGFEGVTGGHYTRETCNVSRAGHQTETLIYHACHTTPGPPRDGYLERVVGGARAYGLPEPYIRELASWFSFSGT